MNDKLSATMEIAKRIHSLAQEQNESALMIGAYRGLAGSLFFLGDFEATRKYAMRGVEIWRSGGAPSHSEFLDAPAVVCLCYEALSEWHFGEAASCQAGITEAISLAKELNDPNALALALHFSAYIAHYDRKTAEVERLASDLIELSTRHHFALWQGTGAIFRGWARSASGSTTEGILWLEEGIQDFRATGTTPKQLLKNLKSANGFPTCTGFALYFSRLWVRMRPKSRLRCARPLESQRSRSRFR